MPATSIGRAYRRVLGLRGAELLAYGDPEGHAGAARRARLDAREHAGLSVTADDVLVTRGSQMALSLAARALLASGRRRRRRESSAIGRRGRPFARRERPSCRCRIDRDGLDVEALATLRERTPLRAVYVTPHHQYPTTVTLKAARRLALLSLARAERMAIIEDDYDHEFHYDGRPVLAAGERGSARVVVYIGTLSKILAPGLRLGYIVAPPAVLQQRRRDSIAARHPGRSGDRSGDRRR